MRVLAGRRRWEPRPAWGPQIRGRKRSGTWESKPGLSPAAGEEYGPDRCKAGGSGPLCAAGLRCQPRGFLGRPGSGASPLTGNGASTGRLEGGRRTRCATRPGGGHWELCRMRDGGRTPVPEKGTPGLYLLLQPFPTSVPSPHQRVQPHPPWAAPRNCPPYSERETEACGCWVICPGPVN